MANSKTITISFDQYDGTTQTESEVNLNIQDEMDIITENIVNAVNKSMIGFFQTNYDELEIALQNNSEMDFVQHLSHYEISDQNLREKIYSLVNQALNISKWKKSHLKILVRTGILAKNSNDFIIARSYFNQALQLNKDNDTRVAITLSIGNCYAKDGKLDSAITIYQNLLSSDLKKVSYDNIAWCHHNLGLAYIEASDISQGIIHFKKSAKIRSSNNEPNEPYQTLGNLAFALELADVHSSISIYDEISTSLENDNTTIKSIRNKAHAYYGAARLRCLELRKFSDALRDINHAIPLLQRFVEDRDCLAGALNVKILCLENLNRHEEAEIIKKIREDFLNNRPSLQSSLIENTLNTNENNDLKWRVQILQDMNNFPEMTENELLFFIEEKTELLEKQKDSEALIVLSKLLNYYGEKLLKENKYNLALNYFNRAKTAYPSNTFNNISIMQALYNSENYADAISFSKEFISKNSELYQGYMILGLSAHKVGNYSLAETMLEEALTLKPDLNEIPNVLKEIKKTIKEQKINGNFIPFNDDLKISPSNHKLFLEYLHGFKSRAKSNSESFWKSYANQEFIQNPENIGRALLTQDLNAGIQNVNIYKESILAGGRIDLIVNILGNEFIIELKMCGNGYSKTYAEGGFEQLKSYMTNRNATRSYLIIFDSRVKQTGKDALPSEHDLGNGQLAFCIGIDIRSMK
ncbi:tetratricopeptide repeat protein [Acinetobacter gerneri]|uniref:tetratricopeptide repeat protein n=1 Tax=Acinetobacter gerneri TaxID=202952 RepID=UPI0028A98148|nr:tetratricopeptide repeat protein [Acinetobacter gerneri]